MRVVVALNVISKTETRLGLHQGSRYTSAVGETGLFQSPFGGELFLHFYRLFEYVYGKKIIMYK